MAQEPDYLQLNLQAWNSKVETHFQSDFYDVEGFLKGREILNSIELELLGDLNGKKVLHLQCHFGLDSLAMARHGAAVTGVDFSDAAVSKAKELTRSLQMSAEFICSDVYQLPSVLNEKFDIVYTSYGTIGWLPDLKRWGQVISHFLKPGGRFVFAEFHPVVWMFDSEFNHLEYSYFNTQDIVEEESGTYADRNDNKTYRTISWNHSLDEVFSALLNSGLTIESFREFDYSPYACFRNLVTVEEGKKYMIKGKEGILPMVYSLSATKNH